MYMCVCMYCCHSVTQSDLMQHARPPCPSPSPRVCPSSCLLHRWCHLAILSSGTLFFFCAWSFPASGSFPMSHLFITDDQNTGASATASVLPMNIQSWFPIGLTGLISLLSKELSRPNTTIWKHQFFLLSLLYDPTLFPSCHVWMWELSVDNLKQMENFAILDS